MINHKQLKRRSVTTAGLLLYVLVLVVLPVTVIDYASNPHVTLWTFAPGVLAAIAILGYLYLKWWREGRLR